MIHVYDCIWQHRDVWGWLLCSVKGFGHFVRLLCVEYFGIYLNTVGIPAASPNDCPGAHGRHLDVSLAGPSALHWPHHPTLHWADTRSSRSRAPRAVLASQLVARSRLMQAVAEVKEGGQRQGRTLPDGRAAGVVHDATCDRGWSV